MAFAMVDKNKDGGIDMGEFEAVMGQMRRGGGGQQPAADANKPPMGR
jgi:Ca2+-binding EF-hand superfamily protein